MTNLMENALVLDLCMAQNILSLLGQSLDWIVGPEYSFSVFLTWKMKNQPGTMENHENRPETMKNQPGTMKTQKKHLEL